MRARFINILNLICGDAASLDMGVRFSPYTIKGFKEVEGVENAFKLERERSATTYIQSPGSPFEKFAPRTEPTFLWVYPPAENDVIFTVQIKHICGRLDPRGLGWDSLAGQLIELLDKNSTGTFLGTGAFIGTEVQGNTMYASLNCMLHFLTTWADEDIVKVLCFQLSSMFASWEDNQEMAPAILQRFEPYR